MPRDGYEVDMGDHEHRWVLTMRRVMEERFRVHSLNDHGDWTGSMDGGARVLAHRKRLRCSVCGETREARNRLA